MKYLVLVFLAYFGFTTATPIIGGEDVGKILQFANNRVILNPGTLPFLVLVKREGHACSGVIIKRNAVLTAAHCIDTRPQAIMSVWAGIIHREFQIGQGQEVRVIDHSLYRKQQAPAAKFYEDDIGILWLGSRLTIVDKQVEVASLPPVNFKIEGKDGLTAGWGMNCVTPSQSMLQRTTLKIISQKTCQRDFKHKIADNVFCVLAEDKMSTISFGDSGSPFIVDGLLVGISSYGSVTETHHRNGNIVKKCNPAKPAVFTKITYYLEWIKNEIANRRAKKSKNTKSSK